MTRRIIMLLSAACLLLSACDSESLDMEDELERVPISDLIDGTLTIENNPSGIAPLTAKVSFQSTVPVHVSLRVEGEDPLEHVFDGSSTMHTLPVYGLYADRLNEVVLRLDDDAGNQFAVDTLSIMSPPLPDYFPEIDIRTADPVRMEPGWNMSSLSIAQTGFYHTHPIIFDNRGAIRWTMDLSDFNALVVLVRRLANGNLLFGIGSALYEYDMLGNELRVWDLPGYTFHHDVIEKPDGNFIVAVDKAGIGTAEDHVIEIDRTTGTVLTEWDLRQVLDIDRFDFQEGAYDWFHMNSVWYDQEDDALIISGRHQGIVKVSRNNELIWILAPHKGWGQAGVNGDGFDTSDYLLTAVDAGGTPLPEDIQSGEITSFDFQWTWGQHAAMETPSGHVFAFDNGANREFGMAGTPFSRGVEYEINESAMTVRQIWEYGENRGPEFYSSIISDVDILPETGNRLIMPGIVFNGDSYAAISEVEYPGGSLIFDARINFKNLRSPGELSGAWGNFDLVYRSERLSMYP